MLEKIIINLDMDSYKLRSFIYKMALLLWPAERSGVEVSQAVVMAALASMASQQFGSAKLARSTADRP